LAFIQFLNNYSLAQVFILLYNYNMIFNIEEKGVKFFLLTYLIFVLICTSAISAGEAFGYEYSHNDNLNSGTYFSSVGHNIDWLARVTIRKANGASNSHLRSKLLRIITFAGIIAIATHLMRANQKNKNNKFPTIRNLVLLKLRI